MFNEKKFAGTLSSNARLLDLFKRIQHLSRKKQLCKFVENEEIFKHHLMSEHPDLSESIINLSWEREKLLLNYELSRTNQEMVLFKATEQLHDFKQYKTTTNRWELFNTGKLICHNIKGTHQSIINYSNSKNMLYLIHEHLK